MPHFNNRFGKWRWRILLLFLSQHFKGTSLAYFCLYVIQTVFRFSEDIKIFHAYLHFLSEYLLSWHTYDVWRPIALKMSYTEIIESQEKKNTHTREPNEEKQNIQTKYIYRNIMNKLGLTVTNRLEWMITWTKHVLKIF